MNARVRHPVVTSAAAVVCAASISVCAAAQSSVPGAPAGTRPLSRSAAQSASGLPPVPPGLANADPMIRERLQNGLAYVRAGLHEPDRWRLLGEVFHANAYLVEAEECYEATVSINPADARSWYLLALVRETLGEREGAMEALTTAARLAPTYAPIWWRRALWLLESSDLNGAEAALAGAIERNADDPAAWYLLARLLLARDMPTKALEVIESRLIGGYLEGYARQLAATAARMLGDPDRAAMEAARATQGRPSFRDVWLDEALKYETGLRAAIRAADGLASSGRLEEAIGLLESTRSYWPGDATLLSNLAVLYGRSGTVEQALLLLGDVLESHPDDATAHLNAGSMYAKLLTMRPDAIDLALAHVERAIELNPGMARAHQARAMLLNHAGRLDEALASYKTAIACDGAGAELYVETARLADRMGRWADAAEAYERAASMRPDQPELLLDAAETHLRGGNMEAARQAQERASRFISADNARLRRLQRELNRPDSSKDSAP